MSFSRSVAIACAPVVAIVGILAATSAEATELRSGTIFGYRVDIMDSGSRNKPDYIEVQGPRGKEQIVVTCSPYDWQSKGPHTAEFADAIANAWCF